MYFEIWCTHCFSSCFFLSAPSPEIEQVCDCQPETSGSPGEERHEGPLGLSGQRRLMVQHLPILQTKVKRGQSRRWRQGKNMFGCFVHLI